MCVMNLQPLINYFHRISVFCCWFRLLFVIATLTKLWKKKIQSKQEALIQTYCSVSRSKEKKADIEIIDLPLLRKQATNNNIKKKYWTSKIRSPDIFDLILNFEANFFWTFVACFSSIPFNVTFLVFLCCSMFMLFS